MTKQEAYNNWIQAIKDIYSVTPLGTANLSMVDRDMREEIERVNFNIATYLFATLASEKED